MTQTKNHNDLYYFYGTLVFAALLISAGGLLYRGGYRLNSFGLVQAGAIELAVHESGSKIYIDGVLQKTTSAPEEIITFQNISPDTHTITILKDGFETWQEDLDVKSRQVEKVASFLVPKKFTITQIMSPEKIKEINLLFGDKKDEIQTKKIKQRIGDAYIWAEGNVLFAEWTGEIKTIPSYLCAENLFCKPGPIQIAQTGEAIKHIDFYKDREDVILVSHGNQIDIIQIGDTEGKYTRTLYKGTNPLFIRDAENTIYIKDNKNLFEVTL